MNGKEKKQRCVTCTFLKQVLFVWRNFPFLDKMTKMHATYTLIIGFQTFSYRLVQGACESPALSEGTKIAHSMTKRMVGAFLWPTQLMMLSSSSCIRAV